MDIIYNEGTNFKESDLLSGSFFLGTDQNELPKVIEQRDDDKGALVGAPSTLDEFIPELIKLKDRFKLLCDKYQVSDGVVVEIINRKALVRVNMEKLSPA
jgi:hypothetical protein